MYYLRLEISALPPPPNVRRRRQSLKWHEVVRKAIKSLPKTPLKRAKLTLTRYSQKRPDPDGLVGSFKQILDGLVKCGVLVDDSYAVIKMPTYRWEFANYGEGKIQIIVEEK